MKKWTLMGVGIFLLVVVLPAAIFLPMVAQWKRAALKVAAEKNLALMLNFTGSDWCGWCKIMDKQVFAEAEWSAYAKKNVMLVTLDFPRDKSKVTKNQAEYNREQAKAFAVRGYPTIILMDANGKELTKKVGYRPTSVEKYIASLKKAIK